MFLLVLYYRVPAFHSVISCCCLLTTDDVHFVCFQRLYDGIAALQLLETMRFERLAQSSLLGRAIAEMPVDHQPAKIVYRTLGLGLSLVAATLINRTMHVVLARYCYRMSSVHLSVRPSVTLMYRGHKG